MAASEVREGERFPLTPAAMFELSRSEESHKVVEESETEDSFGLEGVSGTRSMFK